MKSLKFDPSLIPLILDGGKRTTWRYFDDKNLSVGDEITCINTETKEVFAHAQVTRVKKTTFGQLTEDDKKHHEKYNSLEEMYVWYSKAYQRPITETTPVKVIRYKLIKVN